MRASPAAIAAIVWRSTTHLRLDTFAFRHSAIAGLTVKATSL
jgi:hypothetical protein